MKASKNLTNADCVNICLLYTSLALDHDLEIVPVINKIDLPAADPDRVASEVEEVIGLSLIHI